MTQTPCLKPATALLQNSKRPLLISHPRPDGDTIGSTLALRWALLQIGKAPIVACVHAIPQNFAYLAGAETYIQDVPVDADIDLVVAVDMSDLERTGGIYHDAWAGQYPLLVIDHHETNDFFGDLNVVVSDAAATAIPVSHIIEALGVPIQGDIATCLLMATLTDTRGLRTSTTTPEVLSFVAKLIDAGGDYQKVMQRTLDAVPYRRMRGWGIALNRLQLEHALAWTTFPLTEKQKLGIGDEYDLDLGNLLSRVAEANIIASFLEMQDHVVKVSFRSRPGYNVARIAKDLGGGGHRQAAGCSLSGTLEGVMQQVLPLLREALKNGK